jgi:predicted CXXCH cytochrome family protein
MIRLILLALLPIVAFADSGTIAITEGGGIALSCDKTCPTGEPVVCPTSEPSVCPPVPTPAPAIPSQGAFHAAMHPQLAKTSRATCDTCHNNGLSVPKVDKTLCSAYDFKFPGLTFTDLTTGQPAKDPISGTVVTSGGHVAVLKAGQAVVCQECHYPHGGPLGKNVQSSDVSTPCLDCHQTVGSSRLKPGISN